MADTSPVQARPAAALALIREQDGGIAVCMVRRHAAIAFMPDVYVFPGGSVAGSDLALERAPALCAPIDDATPALGTGFRAAALRECFEEAGVLLARRHGVLLPLSGGDVERFAGYRDALNRGEVTLAAIAEREDLVLATDELLHWAHWITPESLPKRFDTHFFLAAMPAGQVAVHDSLETTASIWIAPEEALRLQEEGTFPLAAPTIHQLRALTGLADREAVWAHFKSKPVLTVLPHFVEHESDSLPHHATHCGGYLGGTRPAKRGNPAHHPRAGTRSAKSGNPMLRPSAKRGSPTLRPSAKGSEIALPGDEA